MTEGAGLDARLDFSDPGSTYPMSGGGRPIHLDPLELEQCDGGDGGGYSKFC
jgi:hypothetical protein